MRITKKTWILTVCCVAVLLLSIPLLESDSVVYIKWSIMALIFGIGFYPLSSKLFSTFYDGGWMFSKVIGVAISGFLVFVLVTMDLADFTPMLCLICTAGLIAVCLVLKVLFGGGSVRYVELLQARTRRVELDLILFEELLFLALFLMWAYFAGFYPQAYGTEKFMDYGFMASMMRDETLPAQDIWYSMADINYYYGGQYYAVFLTKLSGSSISVTYNLMRAFVASFAFVLPFGIVYHLIRDRKEKTRGSKGLAIVAGIVSGAAVSLAGNMHYVLYGLFGNVFKLSGYEDYWFPDSTRYIGHNPLTDDQCIHEFPSYSYVLGDLHAHVVNLMFVLGFIGILYAWLRKRGEAHRGADGLWSAFKDPHIWLMGLFIGIFQFTNFWDFAIYFTVAVIAIVLSAVRRKKAGGVVSSVVRIAIVLSAAFAAALPFNMTFESMALGIAVAQNHSALYQLAVLWGLPVAAVILLFVFAARRSVARSRILGEKGFIANMGFSDMVALIFGICAIGLILVPEFVYIRDIYEDGYARSNTMFKLTYQAFILFGMSMSYSIFRILADAARIIVKALSVILLALLTMTFLYFPYAINCWYGNVLDLSGYEGLDATAYLESTFEEDAEAIRWLNENVDGNPVVLEAPGDSYSEYERVSAMTGLPTVVGWYVHEWLWRNDTADLNEKVGDVEAIYTYDDISVVQALIDKYDIEYIFVGSCEREKYGDELNEDLLQSIGEVVFAGTSGENPAYIIQVD